MKNKNFAILLTGQIISLFGSAIQRFSLSLYILDLTGSAVIFANILALSMAPYVFFAPIAGFICDRYSRKMIMVILDLLSGLTAAICAFFLMQGSQSIGMISITMFILSSLSTVYAPAVTSSIPQVVDNSSLVRANSLVQQIASMSNFIGPVVAGLLYSMLGIRFVILINAASFLFSASLESLMDIPNPKSDQCENTKSWGRLVLDDSISGFSYLLKNKPTITRMIAIAGFFNLFLVPVFSVGSPYIIKVILEMSSHTYGFAEGVIALGMIAGGFVMSINPFFSEIKSVYRILFLSSLSLLIMGASLFIPFEHSHYRWVSLVVFTLGGSFIMFALGVSNVVTASYVQQEIPFEMMGKTTAISTAFATICIPLGQMGFGRLLEIFDTRVGFLILIASALKLLATYMVKWNVGKIP